MNVGPCPSRAAASAARLRKGTLEMADPAGTEMFDHVFAEQTPELARQRAEFVAYHASFEGEGA
jgi:2-oxoisovalerate dehydrogenase E1 component alpha subunit